MEEIITTGAIIGSPLMLMAALGCLLFCREESHKKLAWVFGVWAGALLLLFGGGWVLGQLGLAWRDLPGGILAVILIVGWLAINVLTLGSLLPKEMPNLAPVLRWGFKLALVGCACLSMYVTITFVGLFAAFAYDNQERIIQYQGQTLVETDEGFLDPDYNYYVYHGPLVRGNESLFGTRMERLLEDE